MFACVSFDLHIDFYLFLILKKWKLENEMCLHAVIVVMFLNTLIMIKTYMLIKKLSKRTFTKYLLHTGKLWSITNEG